MTRSVHFGINKPLSTRDSLIKKYIIHHFVTSFVVHDGTIKFTNNRFNTCFTTCIFGESKILGEFKIKHNHIS